MKKLLLETVRERRGQVLVLAVLVVAAAGVSLIPPQLLRLIVDCNLNPRTTAGLGTLTALYLVTLLAIGGCDFFKGWVLTRLGQRVVRNTRLRMMEKTARIPLRYFTGHTTGAVTARFTTDAESINTLFADGLISMAVDLLKIIGIIVSIALFSLELAGIALLMIPAVVLLTRFFQHRMLRAQTANLEQLGRVSNHVSESIRSVRMIKLFSKERYMEDGFCRRLEQNYLTKQKVNFYDSAYAPVIQMLRAAVIALVIVLSSGQVRVLGITAGMLAASIDYLSDLLKPIESLGMEINNIQQGISGIRRVDEFLSLPEYEKDETLTAEKIIGPEGMVRVAFDRVHFSFEEGREILNDISFTAEPCTSVTLAGRTGVGKTTLMNLILGLLIPDSGSICVNGVPAFLIPDGEKRRVFGYVEQRFQFVPGDVARQITLGDDSISREQVEAACRFTGLHEYILGLPEGYETAVRDGSEFSFGQRQLLSIARAIVTNPPVLLLDEITANLDSATEERVVGVLNRAREHRTILSISHRSTSIVHCDKLVEIENGRITAQGAPEEILSRTEE